MLGIHDRVSGIIHDKKLTDREKIGKITEMIIAIRDGRKKIKLPGMTKKEFDERLDKIRSSNENIVHADAFYSEDRIRNDMIDHSLKIQLLIIEVIREILPNE